jgi:tetratricopeptide (TPR) repeat protein
MAAVDLVGKGRPVPVVELLSPIARADLIGEPELGLLLAGSWFQLGNLREAQELVNELEEPCRRGGFDQLYRRRLNLEGNLLYRHGDVAGAERAYNEVLHRSTVAADVRWVALSTLNLGALATLRGDWITAIAALQRAATALQNLGDNYNLAATYQNLGITYREAGLLAESDSHFEKATSLFDAAGLLELAYAESERALTISAAGDQRRAEATVRRALERVRTFVTTDHPLTVEQGESFRILGIVLLAQGRLTDAQIELERALAVAQTEEIPLLEGEVFEALALVADKRGELPEVVRWRVNALRVYDAMGASGRAQRIRLSSP